MNALLSHAAEYMHGHLHGDDKLFNGVSTDTRTLQSGELFFALSGPNYDGGEFVKQASDKGAACAVVTTQVDEGIAQITVDDTRRALGDLGAAWRQQQSVKVIAVTGSNGKTTLKELTAACLSRAAPTLATEGNLNNDIGLPLMLLRIEASHHYAVFEMGANHAGEIGYLTSLAQPNVVVISNAGAAHLEGFGDMDGVARAKGEILQGSMRPSVAVLNADDKYFSYWESLASDINVLSFGFTDTADVRADEVQAERGQTRFKLHIGATAHAVRLPLAGIHNVRNACAAAAVASSLGIAAEKIAAALESVKPITGRLRPLIGLHGATLYDDSYNANPLSVIAAGDFLVSLPGESIIVLGDMKELGASERDLHAEVGRQLRDAGVKQLFAIGDLCRDATDAFGEGATWFASIDELIASVLGCLSKDVNVLVKGSRSMRMERVVAALCASDDVRRKA